MSAHPVDLPALVALAASESPPPAVVAREFEALLLGELTRHAARPLPGTKPLGASSAGQLYREQFFQEVARRTAQQGGFGLAAVIERQLGGGEPAEGGETS